MIAAILVEQAEQDPLLKAIVIIAAAVALGFFLGRLRRPRATPPRSEHETAAFAIAKYFTELDDAIEGPANVWLDIFGGEDRYQRARAHWVGRRADCRRLLIEYAGMFDQAWVRELVAERDSNP